MQLCIYERLALKVQILMSDIFAEHHYFSYHFRELAKDLVESEFARDPLKKPMFLRGTGLNGQYLLASTFDEEAFLDLP
ncbi:hypothetical protein [Pseudomonas syringae group genomosp. 3]|nr:hypothetical protein [Pseudomonas syringae group genomosp. 3]